MFRRALMASLLLLCGAAWCQQPVAVGVTNDSKNYHSASGSALTNNSSDAELARSLDQSFSNDPRFGNVQIAVKHHRVVLMGSVESKDAKRQAEHLALNTVGVRDVRNRLKVAETPASVTSAQ